MNQLEDTLTRINTLVEEIEGVTDPVARERSRALVQAILDVHRIGVARLLTMAAERPGGAELVEALAADDTVALLLSLHGLHPQDLGSRVRRAIDELRPRLLADGVAIDLEHVDDDRARVRLSPAAPGGRVRAGAAELRVVIERALGHAAPELATIDIAGLDAAGAVNITLPSRRS